MAAAPREAAGGVPALPGAAREEDPPAPGAVGTVPGDPLEVAGAPPAAGEGGAPAAVDAAAAPVGGAQPGFIEVDGTDATLLEAIADGLVPRPAVMQFGDWVH